MRTKNPYEELANAIVFQAVRDYQKSICDLHWDPNDRKAKALRFETEAFLKGFTAERKNPNKLEYSKKLTYTDYIGGLTELDTDNLIRAAERQVEDAGYSMATMSLSY